MTDRVQTLQLGEDHLEYGEYSFGELTPTIAWAHSIGATKDTPSMWAKADPEFANEDALFVAEQDGRVLMAVADAHFGREPSHVLMREIAARTTPVPATTDELAEHLRALSARDPVPEIGGGTSLLATVFDRATGRGFGASWFDSTFAIVGPAGHRRPLAAQCCGVAYPSDPATLDPERADWFEFEAAPGEILLAYTDGVDCCHYGKPETSVTPDLMAGLFRAEGTAATYLRSLVELALAGVNGNPGGEDNIAAIACAVSV